MTDREPFLLAGPPDLVRAVVEVAAADPELELTGVSGPAHAPERITLRMSATRAERLRREWGGRLLVERDEPIHPAGG